MDRTAGKVDLFERSDIRQFIYKSGRLADDMVADRDDSLMEGYWGVDSTIRMK